MHTQPLTSYYLHISPSLFSIPHSQPLGICHSCFSSLLKSPFFASHVISLPVPSLHLHTNRGLLPRLRPSPFQELKNIKMDNRRRDMQTTSSKTPDKGMWLNTPQRAVALAPLPPPKTPKRPKDTRANSLAGKSAYHTKPCF